MSIKRELTVDYALSENILNCPKEDKDKREDSKARFGKENMKLKWKFQRAEVFKLKDLLQKGYFS